jgi:ABC-type sugar transport system ATPase subunit
MLETINLTKAYPGVIALNRFVFELVEGEIHALMGENGAGKSTLVKVVTGVTGADAGEILFENESILKYSPAEIRDLGINVIFQDMNLIDTLSVAENIYLNRLPSSNGIMVNKSSLYESAERILEDLGIDFSARTKVGDLSPLSQKMVAIARSLTFQPKLIIMDEPTAALSRHEITILFEKIRFLKNKGVSILYISHFLEEVFEIADRITVMRDGIKIGTSNISDVTPGDIVVMMVGHKIELQVHSKDTSPTGDPILKANQISRKPFLEKISLELNKGEILGITGPAGSGKSAIARLLFGVDKPDGGRISIKDEIVDFKLPSGAIRASLGYVPQNRHDEGVILADPILKNISLPSINKLSHFSFINKRKEKNLGQEYMEKLDIKASSLNMQVQFLSGGNQQKVSIAKWLALNPQILILDEPTQGIDVGTKQEIYSLIKELALNGVSVIFISSEPTELAQLCDRVLIIRRGRIANCLSGLQITRENIIMEITGAKEATNNNADKK